jgi:ELWxxDGT repeat protein
MTRVVRRNDLVARSSPWQWLSDVLDFRASDERMPRGKARRGRRAGGLSESRTLAGFQHLESRIALSATLPVDPREMVAIGDQVYFAGRDTTHGEELWVTDGTARGTRLVKDIAPGLTEEYDFETDDFTEAPAGSGITSITPLGGKAVFLTNINSDFDFQDGPESSAGLWVSDGTEAGTIEIAAGLAGASDLMPFGDAVYFFASRSEGGTALWKWDGVSDDITEVNPGLGNPSSLASFGGRLYFVDTTFSEFGDEDFSAEYRLFATDGLGAAPELIRQLPFTASDEFFGGQPRFIGATPSALYFRHDDGQTGVELWKTDGTSAGTGLVKDIDPGTTVSTFTFEDEFGDPVTETTRVPLSSFPDFLTATSGGVALFNAGTDKGGYELWRTDGTPGGTALVKDLAPGSSRRTYEGQSFTYANSSEPTGFIAYQGATYFTTMGGSLWKTNGTATGTSVVKNLGLTSGDFGSFEGGAAAGPAIVGGRLVYSAYDKRSRAWELWTSDGTTSGTFKLKDLPPAVTAVTPPEAGTYAAGQSLIFVVNFTDAVTVSGKPQLALTLGKTAKRAVYESGSGTNALTFRYTVAAGDVDADGIAVGKLSGGITSAASRAVKALLSLPSLNTSGVRVDAVAPAVKSVAPPVSKTYVAGEPIVLLVTFTEVVRVTGAPQIAVTFGTTVRQAAYVSGDGTDVLRFEVVVEPGDAAPRGVKLAKAIVVAPGSGIADAWGNLAKKLSFKAPSTSGVKVAVAAPA